MQITAYSGFAKKPNSTKQPNGGTVINVALKNPTSVLDPVFLLEGNNTSYNYFQWGSRYYFVRDIVILNNNLTEYHCETDVLATWKSVIGSSSQYVTRSASAYNTSIIDMKYPARADSVVQTTQITGLSGMYGQAGTYVLGIVGNCGSSGSVLYYAMTEATFSSLLDYLFDANGVWLDSSEQDLALATQKQLVNPFQYIVSCIWLPFDVNAGSLEIVRFGWWTTNIAARLLSASDREYILSATATMPDHPQKSSNGNYMNTAPFTRRTAHVFTFGAIPLDCSVFTVLASPVFLVNVDLFTGAGKLQIFDSSGDAAIAVRYAQVGVQLQMAQTTQSPMKADLSIASGFVSTFKGNVLGIASGVDTAIDYMMPQLSVSGATGTAVDYFSVPKIVSEFKYQTPTDYAQHGRPCCDVKTISSLSGFIQTEGADLDFAGTLQEKDQILSYMDGGFFYE